MYISTCIFVHLYTSYVQWMYQPSPSEEISYTKEEDILRIFVELESEDDSDFEIEDDKVSRPY